MNLVSPDSFLRETHIRVSGPLLTLLRDSFLVSGPLLTLPRDSFLESVVPFSPQTHIRVSGPLLSPETHIRVSGPLLSPERRILEVDIKALRNPSVYSEHMQFCLEVEQWKTTFFKSYPPENLEIICLKKLSVILICLFVS